MRSEEMKSETLTAIESKYGVFGAESLVPGVFYLLDEKKGIAIGSSLKRSCVIDGTTLIRFSKAKQSGKSF